MQACQLLSAHAQNTGLPSKVLFSGGQTFRIWFSSVKVCCTHSNSVFTVNTALKGVRPFSDRAQSTWAFTHDGLSWTKWRVMTRHFFKYNRLLTLQGYNLNHWLNSRCLETHACAGYNEKPLSLDFFYLTADYWITLGKEGVSSTSLRTGWNLGSFH